MAGELFGLLGASGSGKTTLLRLLGGFETPTSGRVLIDGVDVTTMPPYERPTNMVFQSYALFPHMTVAKNLAFGLKQERVSKQETDRRVEEALDLVQLTGYWRPQAQPVVGWPAAARGPGPCPGAAAQGAAAR